MLLGQRVAQGAAPRASRPTPVTRRSAVSAFNSNPGPPDAPKAQGSREWLETMLSRFGPVRENKAQSTAVLDFEKPLLELDKRIREVRGRRCSGRSFPEPSLQGG
jgi:acetyl-CoA carboxylase carboxyl transferase subunit alpha